MFHSLTRPAALLVLAAPGIAVQAEQTFHNRTGETIFLRVRRLDFGQAVVRMQLHLSGKTPAPEGLTIVREDTKAGTKQFLNPRLGDLVSTRIHVLTNTSRPGDVGYDGVLGVPDGSSVVFKVLSAEETKDQTSSINFRIETALVTATGLTPIDEHLDFTFRTRLVPGRDPSEDLLPAVIQPLDGGHPHRFQFDAGDGLLSLVIPGKSKCECAIL
jgi:hypothetical protein